MHDDGSRIKTIIYTYKSCVSLADVWMMMMICISSISAAHLSPSLSLIFMFLYANCRRQQGERKCCYFMYRLSKPGEGRRDDEGVKNSNLHEKQCFKIVFTLFHIPRLRFSVVLLFFAISHHPPSLFWARVLHTLFSTSCWKRITTYCSLAWWRRKWKLSSRVERKKLWA